jgi:hypothetical protein
MTRPRKKSIEFSRLRLAVFSFASGLFSKICRLVFLRIACFGQLRGSPQRFQSKGHDSSFCGTAAPSLQYNIFNLDPD